MSVSKNRRKRKRMKPRTFETAKSARRYLNRFRWRFCMYHRQHREVVETIMLAFKKLKA